MVGPFQHCVLVIGAILVLAAVGSTPGFEPPPFCSEDGGNQMPFTLVGMVKRGNMIDLKYAEGG